MAVDFMNLFAPAPQQADSPVPYDVQMAQLKRRQAMVDALRKQAGDPIEIQSSGGIQAPIPWTAILAKAIQGVGAGLGERGIDQAEKDAAAENKKQADDLLKELTDPAYHVGSRGVAPGITQLTAPTPQLPGQPAPQGPAPTAQIQTPGIAPQAFGMGAPIPQQQQAALARARMIGGPYMSAIADTYGPDIAAQLAEQRRQIAPMSLGERQQAELAGDIARRNAQFTHDQGPTPQQLIENKLARDKQNFEQNKPIFAPAFSSGYFSGGTYHNMPGGAPGVPTGGNPLGKSPEQVLGISGDAYNMLVGNYGAVPAKAKTPASRELDAALAKRGLDRTVVAPIVQGLQKNVQMNTIKSNTIDTLTEELIGTLQNFYPVADRINPGDIVWTNQGAQLVGSWANDPDAQQYAYYLTTLRGDLAGTIAAGAGKMTQNGNVSADQLDFHEAEKIIKDGLSSGGAKGLQKAAEATRAKNVAIVEQQTQHAQRRIWQTLGVGKEYDAQYPQHAPPQTGGGGGGGGGGQTGPKEYWYDRQGKRHEGKPP